MNRIEKAHIDAGSDASAQRASGANSPKPGSAVEHKSLPLPHERDQSIDAVEEAPQDVMVQAKKDIDAGLVDTDMRATPGLDAQLREAMVPDPVKSSRPAKRPIETRKTKP